MLLYNWENIQRACEYEPIVVLGSLLLLLDINVPAAKHLTKKVKRMGSEKRAYLFSNLFTRQDRSSFIIDPISPLKAVETTFFGDVYDYFDLASKRSYTEYNLKGITHLTFDSYMEGTVNSNSLLTVSNDRKYGKIIRFQYE